MEWMQRHPPVCLRPELVNHIDNMDDYDVVFLGFTNWWYTAPMAVFSFTEEYGLSGKAVVSDQG